MYRIKTSKGASVEQGIALVEALIAILIFSVGVLGIVGMQANMIKSTSDSKYRADASNIAQQRIGQIWADPDPTRAGYTTFVENNTDISNLLPNGRRSTVQNGTQFTITVTWQQPGESAHNFTTIANIAGG